MSLLENLKHSIHYSGDTLNGKYHGIGKLSCTNGEFYYGKWENGIRNGDGILFKFGELLIGTWINDKSMTLRYLDYDELYEYYNEYNKSNDIKEHGKISYQHLVDFYMSLSHKF